VQGRLGRGGGEARGAEGQGPQRGPAAGQPVVDQAKAALQQAQQLYEEVKAAVEDMGRDGLAEAKKDQSEVEQFFAKVWDEAKKELEKIAGR